MGKKQVIPHKPHEKWGEDKRVECAIAVLACGSIEKAARQCHISPKTLGHWSRHDDSFIELLDSLQGEKQVEQRAQYSRIVKKAQNVTLKKLGESTAAQANLIACQATDKGLLLAGKPTSISGKSEDIQALARQFKELSEQWEEISRDHNNIKNSVISTQGGRTDG